MYVITLSSWNNDHSDKNKKPSPDLYEHTRTLLLNVHVITAPKRHKIMRIVMSVWFIIDLWMRLLNYIIFSLLNGRMTPPPSSHFPSSSSPSPTSYYAPPPPPLVRVLIHLLLHVVSLKRFFTWNWFTVMLCLMKAEKDLAVILASVSWNRTQDLEVSSYKLSHIWLLYCIHLLSLSGFKLKMK